MDTARYVVALLTVVSVPPAIVFWLLVHPNVGFWRRLGAWRSYAILTTLALGLAFGIYLLRAPILGVEFGTNYALVALALPIYLVAAWLSVRIRRHLTFRIFVGVPEISPTGAGGKLLSDGPYARVRHPRYAAVILGLISTALFANYLAPYVLVVLGTAALRLIIGLEENELLERFGQRYADYQKQVPMLLPRRPRVASSSGNR